MAKMFYTVLEALQVLGTTEESLRDMGRMGMLREFTDGPRIMYKVDQVEAIAIERGMQPNPPQKVSPVAHFVSSSFLQLFNDNVCSALIDSLVQDKKALATFGLTVSDKESIRKQVYKVTEAIKDTIEKSAK